MELKKLELSSEEQSDFKTVVDKFHEEDRPVRDRQLLSWRRLKFLWEGLSNIYFNSVARDWRVADLFDDNENSDDQDYYDKRVNVFKAYLESIIAALSVVVPPIKCYPDDADNMLDLSTARTGDKIGKLIYRHNDAPLLWLHGLFVFCTEGMVACYNYSHTDKSYGQNTENEYASTDETHEIHTCPNCQYVIEDNVVDDVVEKPKQQMDIPIPELDQDRQLLAQLEQEFDMTPEQLTEQIQKLDVCPNCQQMIEPEVTTETIPLISIAGEKVSPKTRVCQEVYGGLNIKIGNYAKKQSEVPALSLAYEINYVTAIEEFEHLDTSKLKKEMREKIGAEAGSFDDSYEQWARLSPQYRGEYPENVVTKCCVWLRPAAFNCLDADKAKKYKIAYPKGVKIILINDQFGCAFEESMDEHWTLLKNPMSDYLHFTPLGETVVSIQEITNDLISLVIQTIEHGIGQTFADTAVLNFKAYSETEATPGGIFPVTPKSGKSVGDAFHEVKTATLSQEVLPFAQNIQQMAQLASGAQPTLFGGQIAGSETASEYSMSRAQSLQRLQNTWKMFCIMWKTFMGKSIDQYIKEVQYDERDVQRKKDGSFVNIFIRRTELAGRIGKIELEANENLPMSWAQVKDTVMNLLTSNSPIIQQFIMAPENLPIVREAIGLDNFFIPGEDDVEAEHEEIQLLLQSEPTPNPVDPMQAEMMIAQGQMVELEISSIPPDEFIDNHVIRYEIDRSWLISEAGREAKINNPKGYKNVLLHAKEHLILIPPPPEMMNSDPNQDPNKASSGKGAVPAEKPNQKNLKAAPITGEGDVKTVS